MIWVAIWKGNEQSWTRRVEFFSASSSLSSCFGSSTEQQEGKNRKRCLGRGHSWGKVILLRNKFKVLDSDQEIWVNLNESKLPISLLTKFFHYFHQCPRLIRAFSSRIQREKSIPYVFFVYVPVSKRIPNIIDYRVRLLRYTLHFPISASIF